MNNRIIFGALHSLTQRRKERVRFVGLLAMLAVLQAMAVQPEIVADSIAIGQTGALAEITYTLTGEPAVVTINIETNTLADASGDWVSIGGKGTGVLGGEANKVVYTLDKPVKAYWNPVPVFGRKKFEPGAIRVTATAWPTNTPPNYMVADLRHGKFVRYYASTNDLPGGFGNVEYKTSKLLMRKISAKNVVWWMGSPMRIGDEGWDTVDHVPHKVMFTEDYYAGVYELTIGQLKSAELYDTENLALTNISDFTQSEVADILPAERLGHSIIQLRGNVAKKTKGGFTFCESGHSVAAGSVIDVLRIRSGLIDLDLPTEAQWEYACRAGSNAALPCNLEYTEDNLKKIACFSANQYSHNALGVVGPSPVGSFKPNDWGLYDTLGNVSEICLDLPGYGTVADHPLAHYTGSFEEGWNNESNPVVTVDPYGPKEYNYARSMYRGGNWQGDGANGTISAYYRSSSGVKPNYKVSKRDAKIGVRLFCPVIGNVR